MNLDAGKFHGSGEREKRKMQATNARCRGGRESCGVSVAPAGPEQRERLPPTPVGGLQKGQQVRHGLGGLVLGTVLA